MVKQRLVWSGLCVAGCGLRVTADTGMIKIAPTPLFAILFRIDRMVAEAAAKARELHPVLLLDLFGFLDENETRHIFHSSCLPCRCCCRCFASTVRKPIPIAIPVSIPIPISIQWRTLVLAAVRMTIQQQQQWQQRRPCPPYGGPSRSVRPSRCS